MSVLRTIFACMNIAAIEQFIDFAVCGYHFVKLFDFFHRLAHHFVTLHTSSIIGKGTNMRCQCIKIRKSFAFFTISDGTIRQDFNQSGFFDGFQLRCQCFGTIGHWIQVRHSANGGVTAVCCRLCTGTDGLFIKKSRFSQMRMNINETGKDSETFQIENNAAFCGCGGRNIGNDTIVDKYVGFYKFALHKYVCIG